MLTTALNKSPKPPIIVADILVNELNLGSVPPELEILEIGDLAEDRFRGIFKMCYTGDAFLTLKTRVQVRRITNTFSFLHSEDSFPYDALLPRNFCVWICAQKFLHTVPISDANISTTGESLEYILILEAILYISAASRSSIWIDDSSPNHLIGDQVVCFHNTGLLTTKRAHSSLPK